VGVAREAAFNPQRRGPREDIEVGRVLLQALPVSGYTSPQALALRAALPSHASSRVDKLSRPLQKPGDARDQAGASEPIVK